MSRIYRCSGAHRIGVGGEVQSRTQGQDGRVVRIHGNVFLVDLFICRSEDGVEILYIPCDYNAKTQ
jgi:hypothetical protein